MHMDVPMGQYRHTIPQLEGSEISGHGGPSRKRAHAFKDGSIQDRGYLGFNVK